MIQLSNFGIFHILKIHDFGKNDIIDVVILESIRQEISDNLIDVNAEEWEMHVPLLFTAINTGYHPLVDLLVDLGADVNAVIMGEPVIIHAASVVPFSVKKILLSGKWSGDLDILLKVVSMIESMNLFDEARDVMALYEERVGMSHSKHRLFDQATLSSERDSERNEARRHFLKLLSDSGSQRNYASVPSSAALDPLYERFPNFSGVLDYFVRQIALASLSPKSVFNMEPILIVGDAGIGKTRFAKEAAKAMGLEFHLIGCSAITAGWVISGSSTSWSEGRPGMVHVAMRDGLTGNPMISLDEIDKLGGDRRYDGFGPLYQLLEHSTAAEFRDEAVGIPIDCSKVVWMATANNISVIPEPVLSRFTVMTVSPPDVGQIFNVIQSIYTDIVEDNMDSWGSRFDPEISVDVCRYLSSMTPREIMKAIKAAMGEAAVSRQCEVYEIEVGDFGERGKRMRSRIGFF